MRKKVILICTKCFGRNYSTTKNADAKERMEVRKFCPHCNEHTVHKESK
jgi:large subunit ribosomal protein L33